MKPNGRRRWRRLARKHRQKCAHNAMRAVYSVSQAMKDRRTGYELKPLPPPVFSPRSLVGMTMGARKRAARWELAANTPSSQERKLAMASTLRAWYRIGERLRPCLGCFDCGVECWGCHNPHEPDDECCGETGVIRAGRLRPDKRILACTRPF